MNGNATRKDPSMASESPAGNPVVRRIDCRNASSALLAGALHAAVLLAPAAAAAQVVPFPCRDGARESYVVPADVTQLYMLAVGAAGATATAANPPAAGAVVEATLGVSPGQELGVVAGCAGQRAVDTGGGRGGAGYGAGGNGGSSAFPAAAGAGGGGGSAVLGADDTPLVVAGGGGGSGGDDGRLRGGRGGRGSRWGGRGASGVSGGRGGEGGASDFTSGALGWRSATAGSGGGGGGGYGGSESTPSGEPLVHRGGAGGQTAPLATTGGGGGGAGGASFVTAAALTRRIVPGRGPLGDGVVFVAPHLPWKPQPSIARFSCGNGRPRAYNVPADVDQLIAVVSGAGGDRVVADVPVTPRARLNVVAGCQGGASALLGADRQTPLVAAAGGAGGTTACAGGIACDPVETGVVRGDGTVVILAVRGAAKTIPDPPTDVAAAVSGLRQVTVSFTPPADDGNSPVTAYTVAAIGADVEATGSASPIVVDGLADDGVYGFVVTARNARGHSVASVASNSVTLPGPPGLPLDVVAVAGNGTATVSFAPPDDDGGLPVTSYTVTATPGGRTASGSGSPLTLAGLANGTTYTLAVQATNAAGTGPEALAQQVTPGP
jgi:titin